MTADATVSTAGQDARVWRSDAEWPNVPVVGPLDLFAGKITDHPVIQYVEDIEADDYGDHTAAKIMDFAELSMTLVSVRPGEHHPAHWHEQGPHVAIFLSGEGTMRVGDTEFVAAPGAVAIIPPRVVHFSRCTGDQPLEYIQFLTPSRP